MPNRHGLPYRPIVLVIVGCLALAGCAQPGGHAEPGAWERAGPAAPAPSPSPSPTVRAVSIAGVGDIIMGTAPDKLPPNGARGFFDRVAAGLRGDIVMGNFEGALTENAGYTKCVEPSPSPGTPSPSASPKKQDCFAFRMPPAYAGVLHAAGFHILNLANNHTFDYGPSGLQDTHGALDAAGVRYTGQPGAIPVLVAAGIRVAVLGFSPYGWTNSVTDLDAAAALVRTATTKADVVVVNMHAGGEGADRTHVRPGTESFLGENRGDPIAFAHAVIDAGADLVVGHSPHVMRGLEWYKGRLIGYSMGNFAGYQVLSSAGPLGIGGVLQVRLAADGSWQGGKLVPTEMVDGGYPAMDAELRAITLVRDLSKADFGATAMTVGPDGTLTPPA